MRGVLCQFEIILAEVQVWDEAERALQLVSALRGEAMEVLGHLKPEQRASYRNVAGILQRRFGHQHQAEVYRGRLKKRMREGDDILFKLVQDMESLVKRACPVASKDMMTVLVRDSFVDTL